MLLINRSQTPVVTKTRDGFSCAGISAAAASQGSSSAGEGPLLPEVLFTATSSSCKMSLNNEAAKHLFLDGSLLSRLFSSSFLETPIWSLTSVMMQGVLHFGPGASF